VEPKKSSRMESQEPQKDSRWGFRGMTVRNWLELLVVPLVLLGIGLLFQIQQNEVEERHLEAQQHIEEQRAQDEALQTYLEQIGQMLLDKDRPLRQSKEGDEVQLLARARTVTILRRLDSARNRDILQFLREARLVPSNKYEIQEHIVRLDNSNLSKADLKGANLDSFDLHGTDLSGADLRDARLPWSYLPYAKLNGANLRGAYLRGDPDQSGDDADLSDANLSEADLSYDNLSSANLQGANLTDAVLRGTNLSNAKVTSEQLAEAKSLEGATMPNDQKYEDWLKDKEGRRGAGENGGSQ
jgi:Pentapeptide repeats (8 copies)